MHSMSVNHNQSRRQNSAEDHDQCYPNNEFSTSLHQHGSFKLARIGVQINTDFHGYWTFLFYFLRMMTDLMHPLTFRFPPHIHRLLKREERL